MVLFIREDILILVCQFKERIRKEKEGKELGRPPFDQDQSLWGKGEGLRLGKSAGLPSTQRVSWSAALFQLFTNVYGSWLWAGGKEARL